MTDTEGHDATPGASTDGRAACVGESIRGLRERAGQTRGQVAGMMRVRGHAWHAGTVADIEEGRRQLGLLEAGDLLEGLAGQAYHGFPDAWTEAMTRIIMPAMGEDGFRHLFLIALADLEAVGKAQDAAAAALERIRPWLQTRAGDPIADGLVSGVAGRLVSDKSRIENYIDVLSKLRDRYAPAKTKPTGPEYMTSEEAARYLHISEHTLDTLRKNHEGPGYSDDSGRILYSRQAINEWLRSHRVETEPVTPRPGGRRATTARPSKADCDDIWKETFEPYLRQNGGWRLRPDIVAICEKEGQEYGWAPGIIEEAVKQTAREQGLLDILSLPHGRVRTVWYLTGTDPGQVEAQARQDPRTGLEHGSYDDMWKETFEPYLRQNGGWRHHQDIVAICEKEGEETGRKPYTVEAGVKKAAQRMGRLGVIRFPSERSRGKATIWYLTDMSPEDASAAAASAEPDPTPAADPAAPSGGKAGK